jgi:hypothetical protein
MNLRLEDDDVREKLRVEMGRIRGFEENPNLRCGCNLAANSEGIPTRDAISLFSLQQQQSRTLLLYKKKK